MNLVQYAQLCPRHFRYRNGAYEAQISVAGVPPAELDLQVHVENGYGYFLTLGGEVWTALSTDADADKVEAEYYFGQLTVRVPKRGGRRVEVRLREASV